MRGSRQLAVPILIMVLLSTVSVSADTWSWTVSDPAAGTYWSENYNKPEVETLCSVPFKMDVDTKGWLKWATSGGGDTDPKSPYVYLYSGQGQESCDTLDQYLQQDQTLFQIENGDGERDTDYYIDTISTPLNPQENKVPTINLAGSHKFKKSRWANWLRAVPFIGNTIANIGLFSTNEVFYGRVEMSAVQLLPFPTTGSRVLLQRGQVCANGMNLDFTHLTTSPDKPWTTLSTNEPDPSHFFSNREFNAHKRCSENVFIDIEQFQGWRLKQSAEVKTYKFPVYCNDIEFVVLPRQQEGSWPTGAYRLGTSTVITRASGHNNFRFDPDFTDKILRGYTLSMQAEDSDNEGGFTYEIYCLNVPTPADSQSICTEVYGNSAWKTGAGCCFADTLNRRSTVEGTEYVCVQPEGMYSWEVATEQDDCFIRDAQGIEQPGKKLYTDPATYCCAQGSSDANKPHRNIMTDPLFCKVTPSGGALIQTPPLQNPWVRAKATPTATQETWKECTAAIATNTAQAGVDPRHGKYVCYQEQPSNAFKWESCDCTFQRTGNCGREHDGWFCAPPTTQGQEGFWTQDRAGNNACPLTDEVNGVCCGTGVYEIEQKTHDPDGSGPEPAYTYALVCFDGTKVSELSDANRKTVLVGVNS